MTHNDQSPTTDTPNRSDRELGFTVTAKQALPSTGDPLSDAWLQRSREEGEPETTIRRRLAALRSVGNAGTATRDEIETWWKSRTELAAATRATDLACLRSFYRWCQVWEHRLDDPAHRLRAPKVTTGLPRPAPDAAIARLLEACRDSHPDLFRAYALGALAGLRVSEVAALAWADVDESAHHLTVRAGKGSKARRVSVAASTLELIGPARNGDYSVVTGTSEYYTAAALQRRANRGIRRAGLTLTFHQLRHRFGTVAYRSSKDLVAVRDLMGHASMATTAVYAAAADETAQRIAAAVALPRQQPRATEALEEQP